MQAMYNVVIAGKTGVGKSTLVNYLYGDKIAEVGVGKPVTQKGFHAYTWKVNNLQIKLFDSWGLEVGKDEEWMRILDEELKTRGTDKPATEWFHSVFYCIAAGGHRIEEFDTKIINQFIGQKYNVIVILTKADLVSEDEKQLLEQRIQEDVGKAVSIIAICSESKVLGGGIKTICFGKDKIEAQVYHNFWNSIESRLPDRCIKVLEKRLDIWKQKQYDFISQKATAWNMFKLKGEIEKNYNHFIQHELNVKQTILTELENTLKLYGLLASNLNYPPSNIDIDLDMTIPAIIFGDLELLVDVYKDLFTNIIELEDFKEVALMLGLTALLTVLTPMNIFNRYVSYPIADGNLATVCDLENYVDQIYRDVAKRFSSLHPVIKNALIQVKNKAASEQINR